MSVHSGTESAEECLTTNVNDESPSTSLSIGARLKRRPKKAKGRDVNVNSNHVVMSSSMLQLFLLLLLSMLLFLLFQFPKDNTVIAGNEAKSEVISGAVVGIAAVIFAAAAAVINIRNEVCKVISAVVIVATAVIAAVINSRNEAKSDVISAVVIAAVMVALIVAAVAVMVFKNEVFSRISSWRKKRRDSQEVGGSLQSAGQESKQGSENTSELEVPSSKRTRHEAGSAHQSSLQSMEYDFSPPPDSERLAFGAETEGDEESIIASESKDVLISKEGGKFDIGSCTVAFRRKSFDDVTKVHAKAEIDSSKWPPNYICITPMLWVQSERNLLKRASITMKSWCIKNSTYSRKVEVHVLHLANGSTKWDVVARLPLNDLKVFHFDCIDFSPYVIGICEDDLAATDHVVEGHVYAGKGNNFSLAFFLKHDLILKAVEDMMAKKQSEFQLNFSPISVRLNDIISANLKCMDENFRFPKDFKIDFEIDGGFLRLTKNTFSHSSLIGTISEAIDVLFECGMQKNEILADGPHYFTYEWKPKLAKTLQRQQPTTVTTKIEGPIRDLHLLGTGNTHDQRQYPSSSSAERDNDAARRNQQGGPSS